MQIYYTSEDSKKQNKERQKARFWNRILSFITRLSSRKIKGYRFAFLTLTSSPLSDNNHILDHWNVLKKRVERKYGKIYAFIVREFNKKGDLIHLHILLYAPYLPHDWLSFNWDDIHRAKVVYIESIKESKLKSGMLGYLAKYVSKDLNTTDNGIRMRRLVIIRSSERRSNVRRFTYSYFFHAISKLWRVYVKEYIKTYGYNFSDMIKWWNVFIITYDKWDYSTLLKYIVSI